jgi:hypothetical protein
MESTHLWEPRTVWYKFSSVNYPFTLVFGKSDEEGKCSGYNKCITIVQQQGTLGGTYMCESHPNMP